MNLAVAIAILAMTVTFVVTMILSTQIFNSTVSSVRQKQVMYNNIAEIDKAVRANYYGEINDTTLYDMMGAGYMAGIGDANALYYTAAQYTEYKGIQSGKVVGVGVDVVKDSATGSARVVRVYTDSPAQQAGFEKELDDNQNRRYRREKPDPCAGEQPFARRGGHHRYGDGHEPGRRDADGRAAAPPVRYAQHRVHSAAGERQAAMCAFTRSTPIRKKSWRPRWRICWAGETPIDSLVLDVRDNDGGSLTEAMDVIDMLCPVGTIASQEKGGEVTVLDTSDNKACGAAHCSADEQEHHRGRRASGRQHPYFLKRAALWALPRRARAASPASLSP